MLLRYCRKCEKETPRYPRLGKRSGQGDCAPCVLARYERNKTKIAVVHAAWVRANRASEQQKQNAARHGLTLEQFENLLAQQQGKCAGCRGEFIKTPHIDHDHNCCASSRRSCGKCVRGLLCARCNNLLGRAHDSPDLLSALARYLRVYKGKSSCLTSA